MHIHRLTFQGIGSFPGKHTIDFDELGASGFFVIDGKTGTGKTTILDAIMIALYDKVLTTRDGGQDRIRCDYLPAKEYAEVTLDFSVPNGTYRVWRRPRQTRNDGSKPVTKCTLWKLNEAGEDDPGDAIAFQPRDVNSALTAIRGLTDDQFTQTVILPQGDFAQFISASSDKRQTILEQVFGTRIYSDFQDSINEKVKTLKKEVARCTDDIDKNVAQFLETVRDYEMSVPSRISEQLGGLSAFPDRDALDNATKPLMNKAAQRLKTAAEESALKEKVFNARQDQLDEAKRLVGLQQRYKKAQEAYRQLSEAAPMIDTLRKKVDAHHRSVGTYTVYRQLESYLAQLAETYNSYEKAVLALENLDAEDADALAGYAIDPSAWRGGDMPEDGAEALWRVPDDVKDDIDERIAARQSTIGSLKEALKKQEAYGQHQKMHNGLINKYNEARKAVEKLHKEAQELPKKEESYEADVERLEVLSSERNDLLASQAQDEDAVEAAKQCLKLDKKRKKLEGSLDEARKAHERALEEQQRIQQLFTLSASGALAEFLQESHPCPVCGSTDHPSPAKPAKEEVPLSQLLDSKEALASAGGTLAACTAQIEDVLAEMEQVSIHLNGREPDDIVKASKTAKARLKELEAVPQQLKDAHGKLRDLAESRRSFDERINRAQQEALKAGADVDNSSKRLEELRGEVEAACAGYDTVDQRIDAVAREVNVLLTAADAGSKVAQMHARVADASSRLAQEMTQAGFETSAQALASIVEKDELESYHDAIGNHDAAMKAAKDTLDDPCLREAFAKDEPDVEALSIAKDKAHKEFAEANSLSTRYDEQLNSLNRSRSFIADKIDDYAALVDKQGPLWHISEIINGKGSSQSSASLATWVLQSRLDDVISIANPMVESLSNGRYRIVRTDHDHSRKGNQGLSLGIEELETGQTRTIGSASGGETFYCSLALALALSQLVSNEVGGISIETMFIDEGFGTLDSDVLDKLLEHLQGPEFKDRSVGIISHVESVRERFSERIEVKRRKDGPGSTLRVIS